MARTTICPGGSTRPMTAQERIRAALVKENSSDPHSALEVPPADKPTKITVTQEAVALSEGVPQDDQADVETMLPLLGGDAEDLVRRNADATGLATSSRAEPLVTRHSTAGSAAARRSKRLLRIYIAAGALVAVMGLFMFLLRARMNTGHGAPAATPSGLDLKLESQGSGLLDLRWNAQNPRVAQAKEGRLTIRESNQQSKVMTLGPEQLKLGHLYYDSSADGQEFQLEVVDAAGATLAAAVKAPSAPKPATAASEPAPAPKPESAEKSETVSKFESKINKSETPKVEAPVEAPKPIVRSFTPPPSTPRNTGDERPVLLDAPSVAAGGTVAAPSLPLPVAVNNLPVPPVREAAPPPPTPHKVGGHLEPAKLIKRVTPTYPATARAARVQGSVRFMATIGKDGRVSNLQLVSGHALLVQAAKDAVRQWVYQPTMLNGEPVSVVTQIEVNFGLAQ